MLETLQNQWINLASTKLGAQALTASDDFFAPKERMLDDAEPVFIADKYDDNGKWMDGWESRRKRGEGYDHCIVQLCRAGVIYGVDIDTRHFTGNYAPSASIDACYSPQTAPDTHTEWCEIVAAMPLQGDSHHPVAIENTRAFTHVRLNIYPDGGVARLRVYGCPEYDWAGHDNTNTVDLASMLLGARAVTCNNAHFGQAQNLLMPGRGVNMGDGWETRRRREPGHDWAIIALAHAGTIARVEIDTAHFKGNFPHQCSIQGAYMPHADEHTLAPQSLFWRELLSVQMMQMDHIHHYQNEVQDIGPITHARLNIFPDGGVSRLRLHGTVFSG